VNLKQKQRGPTLSPFATKDHYDELRAMGESISQIGSQLSQLSVSQASQETASQQIATPQATAREPTQSATRSLRQVPS